MSRAAFHLLLERYLKNECTEDEKRIVEELYGMLDKQDLDEIDPREINTIEQKLWDRIHLDISLPQQKEALLQPLKVKRRYTIGIISGIAATVAGFLIITGYLFFKTEERKPEFLTSQSVAQVKEYTNNSTKPLSLKFEDGSSVVLQPKAVLKYPRHFSSSSREVTLEGEGFFEVSKDASRPFMVYNRNVVTKVLGTSFIVRMSRSGHETVVAVKTGKVAVSPACVSSGIAEKLLAKTKEVILTPNQKTTFSTSDQTFETTLVTAPEPVYVYEKRVKVAVKEAFLFNDTPVSEVISRFQKAYGISFVVSDNTLYNNTFTGDLSEQSLYNKLDFLCQSIKASYEISGTSIIIKKN